MGFCSQLGLLIGKNLLIQWRSKVWTVFEIVLPLLILVPVILLVTNNAVETKNPASIYSPFEISGDSKDLSRSIDRFIKPIQSEWFNDKWLAYCPRSDASASKLMNDLAARYYNSGVKIMIRPFASETEMETALAADLATSGLTNWTYIGGIVFETIESKNLSYKIRLPKRTTDPDWNTEMQWPVSPSTGPRSDQYALPREPKYWTSAFLTLQRAIDTVFIEGKGGSRATGFTVALQRLPFPSYVSSTLGSFLDALPLLLAIVFWLPVVHTARTVAAEKEARLKEYMSVMGLRSSVYYLSHFITAFAKVGLVAGVAGLLLVPVLLHTSASLLLVTLLLYAVGAVAFALLVSSMFHSGGGAIRGAVILWLISFILLIVNQRKIPGFGGKIVHSLNINSAFYFTIRVFVLYETQGEGVGWFKLFDRPSPDDGYSLGLGLIMMLVDVLWMWLLTLYLDVVYPADEAPSQPPWFFLMPSYWCGARNPVHDDRVNAIDSDDDGAFEREADDQRLPDIDVRRLTKVWGGGWLGGDKQRAVDAVSFRAYRGQVTALLGHNGAGKSTTFAMLTGLTRPTMGDALICQHSIRTGLDAIRQHLGLCPQYNTLFDKLTVREHLKLFCKLKGRPYSLTQVNDLLSSLELADKANSLTMTLSGGMKRKLSLAIALIGGSEVVVLDEPTAGMDPGARHAAWTLLQKEKTGRTVLLTTHYMEEADLLGDRIAILVKGQLRCMGTPLFLKNLFGSGYAVTVVLTSSASPRTADEILAVLQRHCADVKMQSAIGQEATFLLPTTAKQRFGPMFAELESSKNRLCIASFGVSATTMEEVFLKVGDTVNGDMVDAAAVAEKHAADISRATSQLNGDEQMGGCRLLMSHLRAMFTKRFLYTSRHWTLLIPQILFPILLLSLCVLAGQLLGGSKAVDVALPLRPSALVPTKFILQSNSDDQLSKSFENLVNNTSGLQLQRVSNFTEFVLERYRDTGVVAGNHEMTLGAVVGPRTVQALFTGEAYHTPAIALSMADNALFQWAVSDPLATIRTVNHPLPVVETADSAAWDKVASSLVGLLVSLMIMPCMGLVLCGFVTLVVRERATGFKHMQVLSGLHPAMYWLTTTLCDAVFVAVAIVLVLAVLLIGNVSSLTSQLPATVLILSTYAWAMLPLMYCLSFVFSSPNKAYVTLVILALITGMVAFIVFNIINLLISPGLASFINIVCMLLLPTYALGGAFNKLFIAGLMHSGGDDETISTSDVLAWNVAGQNVALMAVSGFAFWALLFIIETDAIRYLIGICESRRRRRTPSTFDVEFQSLQAEDDDVKLERERVSRLDTGAAAVKVVNLTKYFGQFRAVNALTFSTQIEECFGLLGVNGAGKTTTFSMLTGQTLISDGDAIINNTSVRSNWRKACRSIGYCPQFDATLGELTGRETLSIMARIRGMVDVNHAVEAVIVAVGIEMHANKPIHKYSGGNKRRLSVGLALIGRPEVLMLDEPTAGVDPKARRLIWDALSAVRTQGTALVLTSHSMEECEALCTRVGIMVAGSLRCLGSTQHIKSKFGGGSNLTMKMPHAHQVPAAIERVRQTLPSAVVKEVHLTQISFDIRRTPNDKWSELFETVAKLAEELQVVDYSLSQCTLEQAFLELSRSALRGTAVSVGGVAGTFV